MSTPQTCHYLCPHSEPQALPTSTGDSLILVVETGPVSYEVSASFPGYWCMWDFYKPSKNKDFVCPSPLASPLAFKSRFSKGILLLLPEPQAGKLDMRLRTFTPVGVFLWSNYFPVCGPPMWQVWNFIMLYLVSPSLFVFRCRVYFLLYSNIFCVLSMVVQKLAVIWVFLLRRGELRPSILPSSSISC